MTARYLGQAGVDGNAGLLQWSASAPSIYIQLVGWEPFVLAGRKDYSIDDEVVGDPLVGMLLCVR